MNKFYFFLIILVIAILGGTLAFFYMWHKPRTGISAAAPDFSTTTTAFAAEFAKDTASAHDKYNEHIIALSGRVSETETDAAGTQNVFFTNDSVEIQCAFDTASAAQPKPVKANDSIRLKCSYIGYTYDEIFGLQVKLKDCVQE